VTTAVTSSDVAVVIPVRNGAGAIAGCVEAVLAQEAPPAEVVVVDNGSDDGTGDIARAAGARVVVEPRPGVYPARNTGIAVTSAPIVAFTDADCLPEPQWLRLLVAPFANDGVVGAGGDILPIEVRTAVHRWALERELFSQRKNFEHGFLPCFATGNAAYRRSALDAVGGFDDTLISGGDVDLSWRIQQQTGGRLAYVPEARVRHHLCDRLGPLLRQQRRYAGGHAVLDAKWESDPRYRALIGTPAQRMRAVWLLPARVPYRLAARTGVATPVIDAAVRTVQEIGRRQERDRAAEMSARTRRTQHQPAGEKQLS